MPIKWLKWTISSVFPFFHFSDFFNKKYDKSLIFSKLKKANLIKSVRGAQGGYLLSRKASEITVYDVLKMWFLLKKWTYAPSYPHYPHFLPTLVWFT